MLVTFAAAKPVIDVRVAQSRNVWECTVSLSGRPGEVSDQAAFIESVFSNAGHPGHPHNPHNIRARPEGPPRDGLHVRGHGEVAGEAAHDALHVTRSRTGAGRGPRRGHGVRAVERVRTEDDVVWPSYAATYERIYLTVVLSASRRNLHAMRRESRMTAVIYSSVAGVTASLWVAREIHRSL